MSKVHKPYQCWYCGWDYTDGEPLTRDHVIPKSKGGKTHFTNMVLACVRCNGRKADLSLEEYRVKVAEGQGAPVTFYGELHPPAGKLIGRFSKKMRKFLFQPHTGAR